MKKNLDSPPLLFTSHRESWRTNNHRWQLLEADFHGCPLQLRRQRRNKRSLWRDRGGGMRRVAV